MKARWLDKLNHLKVRMTELEGLLSDPDVIADQTRFLKYAKECANIKPVVASYEQYVNNLADIAEAREIMNDSDKALRQLGSDELKRTTAKSDALEKKLQWQLLPKDPADDNNIFLEIRAGTGGDEAALFAATLMKMYLYYAEIKGWQTETLQRTESDLRGYKAVVMRIAGKGAYSRLKFESGAHRVQRVPETESQGRIHTSACTVAVLPEAPEIDAAEVDLAECRIDMFRASGAGGQHVNKTDSAIRITHLPTGMVVECQDERSQHKNKARALSFLKARLTEAARRKQLDERAANRRDLIGSGDRSERIRTYNFPQCRVTDHRINLTLYKLDGIIAGQLDDIIDPLINEHQANQLAALAEGSP